MADSRLAECQNTLSMTVFLHAGNRLHIFHEMSELWLSPPSGMAPCYIVPQMLQGSISTVWGPSTTYPWGHSCLPHVINKNNWCSYITEYITDSLAPWLNSMMSPMILWELCPTYYESHLRQLPSSWPFILNHHVSRSVPVTYTHLVKTMSKYHLK